MSLRFVRQITVLLLVTAGPFLLPGCVSQETGRDYVVHALHQRTGAAIDSLPSLKEPQIPPTVKLEDGLTEDEAVTVALWNNAPFQEVLTDLGFSRAELIQAGQIPNPTFSLLFPLGSKQIEYAVKLPLETFWFRPRRISIAELEHRRVAERLVQSGLDLIRDVRVAYVDAGVSRERIKLAELNAKLLDRIAGLANSRLEAGDASELEVSSARIDALRAREELARLPADLVSVETRFRNLLGLAYSTNELSLLSTTNAPHPELNAKELLKMGLMARPDFRAAELGMEAAGKRIGLARAEVFALTGVFDVNGAGKAFEAGPGIELPIPIFNQNQGNIALADAKLQKAARQYLTVRDRIALEIGEAHTRFEQARDTHETWHNRILPPLQTAVTQSERAYEAGDASLLLVLETTRKFADARLREVESVASLHRAFAELERSVGQRVQ